MVNTDSDRGVDVRRGGGRFTTRTDWLLSRHSFSFGPHYDPANTGFGVLVVSNDDVVAPGGGFGRHPHRDMEIVSWVLQGTLVHGDSHGNSGAVVPGVAQWMSAGTGVEHAEENGVVAGGAADGTLRFVQMWVLPQTAGLAPAYGQRDFGTELAAGDLVTVASGHSEDIDAGALPIRQPAAALRVGRLPVGATVELSGAPYTHVYVARGAVELPGAGHLAEGDAARLTEAGARTLTAVAAAPGPAADETAEVLVWEMTERAAVTG